uniref:Transposase n=1 Tax=Romanomermis culicivorax TaxID=13658 RepID=A0A915IIZ2_ROMCU
MGNKPAIDENYNVKWVIRINKLDQWFKGTFGYWRATEELVLNIQFVDLILKKLGSIESPPCSN